MNYTSVVADALCPHKYIKACSSRGAHSSKAESVPFASCAQYIHRAHSQSHENAIKSIIKVIIGCVYKPALGQFIHIYCAPKCGAIQWREAAGTRRSALSARPASNRAKVIICTFDVSAHRCLSLKPKLRRTSPMCDLHVSRFSQRTE